MPTATKVREFRHTGTSGKSRSVCTPRFAGCSNTAVRAAAPPGGCRVRVAAISIMASPTAKPAASHEGATKSPTAIPTAADKVLPPITARGVASGLAGTANTSTLDAPIGATMAGRVAGAINPARPRHATMPHKAPAPAAKAKGACIKAVFACFAVARTVCKRSAPSS